MGELFTLGGFVLVTGPQYVGRAADLTDVNV